MSNCASCQASGELVAGTVVCDPCAESIANRWYMARGGKWLTWPNEPAPRPRKVVIPAELRTQVFERDLYRCRHCETHLQLRADHVIPESAGGPTTLENLQTLCQPCNSRKGVSHGG